MKRDEMNGKVAVELEHISKGDAASPQNELRMLFNLVRRRDLGEDPTAPASSALRKAIATIARDHPGFSPSIDHRFFRMEVSANA